MRRIEQFAFRVNHDERQAIAALADCLQRSQSDAVRFVVLAAARELTAKENAPAIKPQEQQAVTP